jgi:DNA-binding response OmpR family regulator
MARILLIDDDPSLLEALGLAFEDAGHEPVTAPDGLRGWRSFEERAPDAIVSDVNMPGLDGFSLVRRLRERGHATPFILLTSRDGEIDEALGLELGADDYVAKPFSTRVLLARVAALLRRQAARAEPAGPAPRQVGRLLLDMERIEAHYDRQRFEVTLTEFRLLDALVSRPGVVFSRERLLELGRADDSVVEPRLIDTYIRRLRRKIEQIDPSFADIETVIGAGYRWRA